MKTDDSAVFVQTIQYTIIALLILSSITVPTLVGARSQEKEAVLSAEELAGLSDHAFSPIAALSPDGVWLAYTVKDAKRVRIVATTNSGTPASCRGTDVWLANTRTGRSKSLTQVRGNNWGAVWSPDGRTLIFFSDRDEDVRLWMWSREAQRITRVSSEAVFGMYSWETPAWLPDNSGVIVRVKPRKSSGTGEPRIGKPAKPPVLDVPNIIVFDSPGRTDSSKSQESGLVKQNRSDLAVVELASGKLRRVAESIGGGAYRVSPDGKTLAATSQGIRLENKFLWRWELFTVSLTNGGKRILADDILHEQPFGTWFSWSPDSARIAYTDIGSQVFKNTGKTRAELYVISLQDAKRWSTSDVSHPSFGDNWRAPLWSASGMEVYIIADGALWSVRMADRSAREVTRIPGREILEILPKSMGQSYWSSDQGRSLIVLTRNVTTMKEGAYSIDLESRKHRVLRETDESFGHLAVSRDGAVVVYMSEASDRYGNYWLTNESFSSAMQLTNVNPQFNSRELGKSRLVEWRSPRGEVLRGALLLPPGYVEGRQYPVIVNVYGGIFPSESVNRFGIAVDMRPSGIGQFLATRGYAVFRPDTPLRMGTPMADLADCVLSGIDALVNSGIADPERLGVIGHSYGGYGTLALIVQTERFKAAVVNQGMGNLINHCYRISPSGVSNSGGCEDSQLRMGVTLWQDRERYINNSPIFFLDKVHTPLLFTNGAKDRWSPPTAAEEVFGALKRLGRTAQYVTYLDEGHNFMLYQSNVDFLRRMEAWFDRYLRPRG